MEWCAAPFCLGLKRDWDGTAVQTLLELTWPRSKPALVKITVSQVPAWLSSHINYQSNSPSRDALLDPGTFCLAYSAALQLVGLS